MKIRKYITKKRIVILSAVLLILFIVYRNSQAGLEVEITYPEKGTITQTVQAAGEVTARELAELSFLGGGKVGYIGVSEGSYVNKGEVVASLDKTDLYAAYQQAQADLRSAEATLDRVYDNVKGNDTGESFTQKETRTAAEVAKDKAFDAVKRAQNALANANLVSPISGYAVSVSDSFYVNNFVGPTDVIIVANPETIIFEIEVNEIDIPEVFVGQKALLTLDAYPDSEIDSTVQDISFASTTTSTGGTAYKVKLELPRDGNNYLLGMSGDAELEVDEKNNISSVPLSAIVEEDGKSYLWIIEDDKAKRIEVVTGISSLNDIEIIEGDIEGKTIVVRPPSEIEEGVKMKTS